MQLVLAAVVYPAEVAGGEKELALLKLANFWLQRRNAGQKDSLLLIGVNFQSSQDLRQQLAPLGLGNVEDLNVVAVEDEIFLGERVEPVLSNWLTDKHPAAVSFLNWKNLLGEFSCPDVVWWWTGVEAEEAAELSSVCEGLRNLAPAEFEGQVGTWLQLLLRESATSMFDSEEANYQVCMDAVGLALWFHAYNEITENWSFNFDYASVAEAIPIDEMRLGRDSWHNHAQTISESFDDEDATGDELRAVCLRACLFHRSRELAKKLQASFGDETSLLCALYWNIWPSLTRPMTDAARHLLSGDYVLMDQLIPQLRLVSDGWCDLLDY